MRIISEFGKFAPNTVFTSLAMGALAGVLYINLIPMVLSSLNPDTLLAFKDDPSGTILGLETDNVAKAGLYFGLCILILSVRTFSEVLLTRTAVQYTTEVRKGLYDKILSASIESLEKIGVPRVVNALTLDVGRIVAGANIAPPTFVSIFIILSMLSYLWFINPDIFLFVVFAVFFAALTFQLPMLISSRYYNKTRVEMDELQYAYSAVIKGAKELKLNKLKRDNFVTKELLQAENQVRAASLKADTFTKIAMNYGEMISFIIIGVLAFFYVSYQSVSAEELVTTIMILLYMANPVSGILSSIPTLIQANISLTKLQRLFKEMETEQIAQDYDSMPTDWTQMRFEDIAFSYKGNDNFKVGPLNLTFNRGEVTFIIGGNGSGKSTFSKLLTLHYPPNDGTIAFDDIQVNTSNINRYRQHIAAISSDYHLFNSIHGSDLPLDVISQQVEELLLKFKLHNKVNYQNHKFSTLSLSDGQKRRLALLAALIEDKQLYLFDEFAADQDPEFRDYFYHSLLPELKAKNKAVVVISHDERYFGVADRLYKFEFGGATEIDIPQQIQPQL